MILTDGNELLPDATAKFRAYQLGVDDFLANWQPEAKPIVRSQLLLGAVAAFEAFERLDLAIRRRLGQAAITEEELSQLDSLFAIFSEVWLVYSEQLAKQLKSNQVEKSAPVEQFLECLKQMRSIVRSNGRTEFEMTPELLDMQNAALAEHRHGKTKPFFSFEE